jgi:CO/xanthine dehydrogenase Mo-binding subunit/CO/xanthine dehydrogenase FAD-binding subunit
MAHRTLRRAVGQNVPRKEGRAKVTGAAKYVDDLTFPGMLYGTTIRSTIPAGAIERIRFGFDPMGFVVVDHRDVPGRNVVALIEDDQPCLAEQTVHHFAEPILLVAHPDRERLLDVRVQIDYVPTAPLFDPRRSTHAFKTITIEKGDVERGFRNAAQIIEGEYRTGLQEQLYIEPNGVIAVPDRGGITVYGSLQCPYYVHKALRVLLALPDDKVRVVQTETGGGFGGKEEYPSIIAGHACLLALKARRPVKIVYDRVEDMLATTKRHPSIVRHRTGVTRNGRFTAMKIDVLMDGGAYTTLSPVVLSRGVLHSTGPYRCENVLVRGRTVQTNTPPNGAFRGFGAPQTLFAIEAHVERIAEALGMDPVALRDLNALRPGDTTATGQRLGRDCSARRVLREAVRRTGFRSKRRALRGTDRGIGLALFFHGSGFTGGGEVKLASQAALELTPDGARIRVASTEIGQGTRTMHAQIVADTLGIPYDRVEVSDADTAQVPDSGPTVASRTCMIVGRILQRCAEEMKVRLGGRTPKEYLARHGPLVITKSYQKPDEISWDEATYRGDAYSTYAWGCDVAEVKVDRLTSEIKPIRLTAVQEIGKAIHPMLAAGQIEGGTAQGIGYALLEEVVVREGQMVNAQLTNYIVPTTLDTPEIEAVILENPYRHGPFGAKGVGELPMDGPAPAIVNAMRHLGIDVREIPATPERVMQTMAGTREPGTGGRGPGAGDRGTGVRDRGPGTRNREPGARGQGPGDRSPGPGTGNQEPGTGNREPGRGPGAGDRGPGTGNREPGTRNREPGTGNRGPGARGRGPGSPGRDGDGPHSIYPQRQAHQCGVPPADTAPRRPARGVWADRHQGGLRRRGVRRVHHPHRRRPRELLPRTPRAGGRDVDSDNRRSARATSSPGSVRRRGRRTMRHLHPRDDPGCTCARSEADTGPDTGRSCRESLSLHGLHQHLSRGRRRVAPEAPAERVASLRTAISKLTLFNPRSLREALRMMADEGGLMPLAGCTDVYVSLNFGTLTARRFLNLWDLDDLKKIEVRDGVLSIGAVATYTSIIRSPLVRRRLPMLAAAARETGGAQIQNRGTLGGNIANGSPAGDSLPVLAAADATVVLRSARETRRVPFSSFFTGYRTSVLRQDELVVAVEVPPIEGEQYFRKVGTRAAQSISKVVMAGVRGPQPRIAIGSVAPTIVRAVRTEAALASGAGLETARQVLLSEISPIDDVRSTAEYRRRVAVNLLAEFCGVAGS